MHACGVSVCLVFYTSRTQLLHSALSDSVTTKKTKRKQGRKLAARILLCPDSDFGVDLNFGVGVTIGIKYTFDSVSPNRNPFWTVKILLTPIMLMYMESSGIDVAGQP